MMDVGCSFLFSVCPYYILLKKDKIFRLLNHRGWDQLQEEMEMEMKLRTVGGTIRLGDQSEGEATSVLRAIETLKRNAAIEAAELKAKRQREAAESNNNFDNKIPNNRKLNQNESGKRIKSKQQNNEISDKSIAALKEAAMKKAINSDSSHIFMGNLRKPTLADSLSPELQHIMEKMKMGNAS